MIIEIHRPELEALILERMKVGTFLNVEDVLLQALEHSAPTEKIAETTGGRRMGTDLIAAMQASPYRELDIEPAKVRLTNVRDVNL